MLSFKDSFHLLQRRRDFRRLWLADIISNLGGWLTYVAVSVVVLHAKGSFFDLALVFAAHTLPVTQMGQSTNWASVSVGGGHTCGLSQGGELRCFGVFFYDADSVDNATYSHTPVLMVLEQDWASFTTSIRHECGIKTDQSLWCRGLNTYGSLGHGLGGGNYGNFTEISPGTAWKMISLSEHRTCGITSLDELFCWGKNDYGELGDGNQESSYEVPTRMMPGQQYKDVVVRKSHTCGIRLDGTMWCWGYNYWGETGSDQRGYVGEAHQIGTDNDWASISAGRTHSCGLKTDQTLWCWGDNSLGQLGNGLRGDLNVPVQVGSALDWQSVSAGTHHTCGTKAAGELWCWGRNSTRELGIELSSAALDAYVVSTPRHIDNNPYTWRSVSAASEYSCGVSANNQLYCWGSNTNGRMGLGSSVGSATITAVRPQSQWQDVSSAGSSACALDTLGTVWCWGVNTFGQLGIGNTRTSTIPVQMTIPGNWDTSSAVSQISHGGGHACLVKDNKSLWCWGENGVNQSEESVSTNTSTVAVRTETGMRLWSEVTAGRAYTCGRQNDGTLMCRGYNIYGTLGDGTTKTRRSMTAVATGGQWRTVDAGEYHTCGIKTDDSLWCWGRNRAGEVGDGSGERKTSPVEIGQGQGWESVSAGQYHTCAIAQNGSLWCWGQNQGGQLGHGVMPLSSQPVETRRP